MNRRLLLFAATVLIFCSQAATGWGDTIGNASTVGFTGTYAGVRHGPSLADDPGSWEFKEEDDNLGTNNVSSSIPGYNRFYYDPTPGGQISASAAVASYGFNGHNGSSNWYASGVSWPSNSVQVGGFFRDELYFETFNGSPGYLEFDFDIHYAMELGGDGSPIAGSFAKFEMHLLNYTGEGAYGPTFTVLDSLLDEINSGSAPTEKDFEGTITFSTNGAGDLLASGKYLPLSFTNWTYTNNASIDWLNTVTLADVRAYDSDGNLLNENQYTLLSQNSQFFNFENEMSGSPVPEPATLLLLTSGMLGLVGSRLRQRK